MHTLFVYYEGIKLEDVLSSISLKLVSVQFPTWLHERGKTWRAKSTWLMSLSLHVQQVWRTQPQIYRTPEGYLCFPHFWIDNPTPIAEMMLF